MQRIDFGAKLAVALPAKNKIHRHRKQRRHSPLEHLAADPALVGHLLPHDAHEIRTGRDKIDGVDDCLAHPLLPALAPRPDRVGRILQTLEHLVEHRDVELLLGGKMMQQRRRLDSDAACAISRRLVPRYPCSANNACATCNTRSRVSVGRRRSTTLALTRDPEFLETLRIGLQKTYLTPVRESNHSGRCAATADRIFASPVRGGRPACVCARRVGDQFSEVPARVLFTLPFARAAPVSSRRAPP